MENDLLIKTQRVLRLTDYTQIHIKQGTLRVYTKEIPKGGNSIQSYHSHVCIYHTIGPFT